MWRKDLHGRLSPELELVKSAGLLGMFGGVVIGAYQDSRKVFMEFMKQNKVS